MYFASTHDNNVLNACPTLMFDLASSSVSMTRTFAVEAWLDNIIPLTPLLKPICPSSTISDQFPHYGKRKRGPEHEQPPNPELNQQQYSALTHRPNKQPRIEPVSQRTRSSLRKATVKAMSRTPVYAQVWSENFSVSRPQLILHCPYSNLLH